MDHLIGQRFNLISKSEIRYLGTLHEINPEQSTIALEDVYSFGTEGRQVDTFIPPSQQKFDYIVFRGSDVKDIKIAEEQSEPKQPSPPSIPNDPAILNSSRPGPPPSQQGPPSHHDQPPFPPPGYPPQPQFGGYYPPQQQYGRGFGPPPGQYGPGPGFQGMPPYGPPPPGYYGPPPGQGFQGGPPNQFSPPPIGPPGQRGPPGQQQGPPPNQQQNQVPKSTSELPVDNKAADKPISKSTTPAPQVLAAPPAGEVKPTVSDAMPPATKPTSTAPPTMAAVAARGAPTGPKGNRVTPAVPMTVNQKSFVPPTTSTGPLSTSTGNQPAAKAVPTAASMEEASRQAKEAVAAAMAKLNGGAAATTKPAGPSNSAMDALTKKVGEMRTNDGVTRGRGNFRGGRGAFRGGSGGQPAKKIEIPKDDYDFESANAKFNKEDMVKEAIASGSPLAETAGEDANGTEEATATNGEKRKDSLASTQAYNKTSSFFDNISSETKDRQEAQDERINGRQLRSEEYKKNLDTFGQGNVDGGGYRGRGRGRGFRGGYNRGYNRVYGGGNRGGFDTGVQRGGGRGGTNVSTS